jgi:hypothetical protein
MPRSKPTRLQRASSHPETGDPSISNVYPASKRERAWVMNAACQTGVTGQPVCRSLDLSASDLRKRGKPLMLLSGLNVSMILALS